MRIGTREFDVKKHTYVMGILNVTPDSFSDGGSYPTMDHALRRAEEMVDQGADILDVGGESTRPGYVKISDEEEIDRTVPVIERLKKEFNIPISIDTYKPAVAREALLAGADMVNDIWGLGYDESMAGLIGEYQVPCCLMHNRKEAVYKDFIKELKEDLRKVLQIAKKAGIRKEHIILDPGVGFGKTYENNLMVIDNLEKLGELGCPVLLGASRKSVIGIALDLPVTERLEGTLVTTVYAVLKGCAFVRVHDIRENVRAIRMAEAIRDGFR